MNSKLLSVGMSTYDDYDGVFFSIQSLRMYHEECKDVEFIVLDGNPNGEHGKTCKNFITGAVAGKYIAHEGPLSSFNKYDIVKYVSGQYVLIMDCHVMIEQNGIKNLLNYFNNNPDCKDLVQGPLLHDNLINVSTHFDPVWRGDMFGTWGFNKEAYEKAEPFEIQLQGMGLLSFERKNWPGIGKHFKGFGGEEGYISEKFRRNGGKNVCLPNLRWNHRFGRPNGVKYPLILEDRIWNYFVGWLEITKDSDHKMIVSICEHFKNRVSQSTIQNLLSQAKSLVLS